MVAVTKYNVETSLTAMIFLILFLHYSAFPISNNSYIHYFTFIFLVYIRTNLKPFKPQYPQANSPNWSLYISLKNELREFDKRSKYFLFGDHFINSHNLVS